MHFHFIAQNSIFSRVLKVSCFTFCVLPLGCKKCPKTKEGPYISHFCELKLPFSSKFLYYIQYMVKRDNFYYAKAQLCLVKIIFLAYEVRRCLLEWNNHIKRVLLLKQPSNAQSALIARFQTYLRCQTFKQSLAKSNKIMINMKKKWKKV